MGQNWVQNRSKIGFGGGKIDQANYLKPTCDLLGVSGVLGNHYPILVIMILNSERKRLQLQASASNKTSRVFAPTMRIRWLAFPARKQQQGENSSNVIRGRRPWVASSAECAVNSALRGAILHVSARPGLYPPNRNADKSNSKTV
eukprot:3238141-Amphidinium_carterae.1